MAIKGFETGKQLAVVAAGDEDEGAGAKGCGQEVEGPVE